MGTLEDQLAAQLGERTLQLHQLQRTNAALLEFVGKIATSQPMQPRSYDAEQLLKKIGHPEYTRRCEWCDDLPASPTKNGKMLCNDCGQEEEAKYVE